ncbi:coiled-coil domain-containing protein [Zavarzinella formosa]|uniref:hypothetical protein n=1 Tax=Zavarzinella formosa TaxID=360055 RepID=UPI000313AC76|nr:hypothetical protein [Zavarzinella formosa]
MQTLHRLIGLLEIGVAITLVVLGAQIPGEDEVTAGFARTGRLTGGAEKEIGMLREQVDQLRRQDFASRAEKLRTHTRTVSETATKQQLDFRTIEAMAQAMGDVSKAIKSWSETIDTDRMKTIATGFAATATMLDNNAAASEKAADEVDQAMNSIAKDGARLAELLKQSPPDLKAAKIVYDGLGTFDAGLEKLDDLIKAERVDSIKEGLAGLDESITGTAGQVEKLGNVTYPVMTINGLKPTIETKSFWPEAPKVAEGLKKASTGVQATSKELDRVAKSLPEVRKALAESRKSIARSRESVGSALKQQAEAEKLLVAIPKEIAELAEGLPKIGKSFSMILRETKKLKELAAAMRATQAILEENLKRWPEVANGLKKSAIVLDQAQAQLLAATKNRDQYEQAMASTSQVAKSFADLLPEFTEQLDSRLEQQHASLSQMEHGLGEINTSLPQAENQTLRLLRTVKWLLWLVSGLILLHALTVFRSTKPKAEIA